MIGGFAHHEDIGSDDPYEPIGFLTKRLERNHIHVSQMRKNMHPLFLRNHRSVGAFACTDFFVAVDADNEQISELLRSLKIFGMANVEKIPGTGSKDDAQPEFLPVLYKFCKLFWSAI